MSFKVTNWGKAIVSGTYDDTAITVVLNSGHGSRFPSTFPFRLEWYNATDFPDPADDPNREIVHVTNRVTDTLTVVRGAEGSGASTKNASGKVYRMILGYTKEMHEELQARASAQTFNNLRLQTHTDSDVQNSKVMFSADFIILSDGERVANWDKIVLDLTATGVNGLDTGSEQASTWYSVHAVYNGSTKGGLFHREKDYFLDEDSSSGEDASQALRSLVDNSNNKISQGFKVDTAGKVPFVDVRLTKNGTITGNYWLTIQGDNSGVPDEAVIIATSDKYNADRLVTGNRWMRIPFRSKPSLSAATQYHLVLQGDYTVSGSNFIAWRMDGSAGAYGNGSKALFDSDTSTWTQDTDDDMMFKMYIERNEAPVTLPSGYVGALIGYIYNNSSSNLLQFFQKDHTWRLTNLLNNGLLINETSGAPALIDLFAVVPPQDLLEVVLSGSGTGAATAALAFAGIRAGDLDITAPGVGVQVTTFNSNTNERPSDPVAVLVEYSSVLVDGTSGADVYSQGFNW